MSAIAVLMIVVLGYLVRDGVLAWWLINLVMKAHGSLAAPAAGAAAGAGAAGAGGQPAAPVVPPQPRNTAIVATSFGGRGDTQGSAYGGMVDPNKVGFALPYKFDVAPKLRVFYRATGKFVDGPVVDVGPWNVNDPYWNGGARPQAETGTDASGRRTNRAGIDLTPAAWAALGYAGDPNEAKSLVDWDFVDHLGAAAASPSLSSPPAATPPWLATLRGLIGLDAAHGASVIMTWPAFIASQFPEMASYCAGYTDDSIPWCGLTVAYAMAKAGIRPPYDPAVDTNSFLWAFAWANWGTAVDEDSVQPGDVLVFRWAGGGGHVTVYDHEVDDDYYHCTGGNQGNTHQVSTEAMPMSACIAIRRPPAPSVLSAAGLAGFAGALAKAA